MDGARDAVLQLEVHLGNCVFWEYGGIRDITCGSVSSRPSGQILRVKLKCQLLPPELVVRAPLILHTDSSGLDHVADGESLDCLVLWCASRAVAAADGLDVATSVLVSAAVNLSASRHRL